MVGRHGGGSNWWKEQHRIEQERGREMGIALLVGARFLFTAFVIMLVLGVLS